MKTIGITGGTGFIGHHITKLLTAQGYKVVIFTRTPTKHPELPHVKYSFWDAERNACDNTYFPSMVAFINLAGAGIADKRWTDKRKKEIVESRVIGTTFMIQQLKAYAPQCTTFISASATGYYGADDNGTPPFTEDSPPYTDFLANTCIQWEAAAKNAQDTMRLVILRFGIVLGKEHGAFAEFTKPMSFGIMPILGSGSQIVSWIEVDDLANMICHAIEHEQLKGIYNAVSPQPVTHKELVKTIAHTKGGIKIPAPVPAFALKLVLGELSTEVLKSVTVSAKKITDTGFTFHYPDIKSAVKAILKK